MSWKGKGKPWKRTASGDGQHYSSSYYSAGYGSAQDNWGDAWYGAYSKDVKKEDSKHAFPAYNRQPQKEITVISENRNLPKTADVEEDAIKEIQRAVNAARKAEQRVNKLQMDLQKGQSQWASYEQALKKAFATERARYQGDQAKLRQELAEALANQAATRTALRSAAVGQLKEEGPSSGLEDVAMEDAWLGFLRDTTMVETGEQRKELNSWLQGELDKIGSPESAAVAKARLIAAMRQGQQEEQEVHLHTPGRRTQGGIASPSQATSIPTATRLEGPRALFPFGCRPGHVTKEGRPLTTQATQYREDGSVLSDPYLVSPSQNVRGQPESGHIVTPPSAKHRKTPRSGVKDSARPKGPALTSATQSKHSLADKLLASRLQADKTTQEMGVGMVRGGSVILDDDQDHLHVPIPSGSELEQLDS